jgi:hypothetical protein
VLPGLVARWAGGAALALQLWCAAQQAARQRSVERAGLAPDDARLICWPRQLASSARKRLGVRARRSAVWPHPCSCC